MSGLLVQLVGSLLLSGNGGNSVMKLLQAEGSKAIIRTIAQSVSPVSAAVISGKSLDEIGRSALIQLVGGSSSPFGRFISGLSSKEFQAVKKKKMSKKLRRQWEEAHRIWLQDNLWRYDWRSQPRLPAGTTQVVRTKHGDRLAGGTWTEGRLDHPVSVKYTISRSVRQRRTRAMKAYKARTLAAGASHRPIMSSWGTF